MTNYFEEIQKRLTQMKYDATGIKLLVRDPRPEGYKSRMYEAIADQINDSIDIISELLNYFEQ